MVDGHHSEKGTGIFIPEDIWSQALPDVIRYWAPKHAPGSLPSGVVIDIRLRSGTRIDEVVVREDGEILFQRTGLRGPEFTTEGLDFTSEDIEAIRVAIGTLFFGFGDRFRWFARTR